MVFTSYILKLNKLMWNASYIIVIQYCRSAGTTTKFQYLDVDYILVWCADTAVRHIAFELGTRPVALPVKTHLAAS